MAMSWLTWCPKSVMAGGKKNSNQQICVEEIPLQEVMDGFGLYVYGLNENKALQLTFFFKQSDTRVPLLLLVKAHHSLNIHTTLSGPSASVSELSILSIYLSSLFSLSAPSLLVL